MCYVLWQSGSGEIQKSGILIWFIFWSKHIKRTEAHSVYFESTLLIAVWQSLEQGYPLFLSCYEPVTSHLNHNCWKGNLSIPFTNNWLSSMLYNFFSLETFHTKKFIATSYLFCHVYHTATILRDNTQLNKLFIHDGSIQALILTADFHT